MEVTFTASIYHLTVRQIHCMSMFIQKVTLMTRNTRLPL